VYLADSNFFVELLLDQERADDCQRFLRKNLDRINISALSIHSVGIALYRRGRPERFPGFLRDTRANAEIRRLPLNEYGRIEANHERYGLDFEDSYQLATAEFFELSLVTMDKDFKRALDAGCKVEFL